MSRLEDSMNRLLLIAFLLALFLLVGVICAVCWFAYFLFHHLPVRTTVFILSTTALALLMLRVSPALEKRVREPEIRKKADATNGVRAANASASDAFSTTNGADCASAPFSISQEALMQSVGRIPAKLESKPLVRATTLGEAVKRSPMSSGVEGHARQIDVKSQRHLEIHPIRKRGSEHQAPPAHPLSSSVHPTEEKSSGRGCHGLTPSREAQMASTLQFYLPGEFAGTD
jgi:hypothetical protein